jgi:putative acetyltransferase
MPAEMLVAIDVDLYSCRSGDHLLAIGTLRRTGDHHFEIKSMHTAQHARGCGVGRMMLDHLISVAWIRGANHVSLETGTSSGFHAARSLYERSGLTSCAPVGDHSPGDDNVCLTLALWGDSLASRRRGVDFTVTREQCSITELTHRTSLATSCVARVTTAWSGTSLTTTSKRVKATFK